MFPTATRETPLHWATREFWDPDEGASIWWANCGHWLGRSRCLWTKLRICGVLILRRFCGCSGVSSFGFLECLRSLENPGTWTVFGLSSKELVAKHYALLPAWQPIVISILAPLTVVLFVLGQAQRGKPAIIPAPFGYMAPGVTIAAGVAIWMLMCRTGAMIERRLLSGECVHSGYDLRATPLRCPECGAKPAIRR